MIRGIALEPATSEDAAYWADLMTEAHPDEPRDPDSLRHQWRFEDSELVAHHWLVVRAGRRLGVAEMVHSKWDRTPERFVTTNAWMWPGAAAEGELAEAYDELERRGRAEGGRRLESVAREDDGARIAFLEGRGFVRDRVERMWELDLVAHGAAIRTMAERAREQMRRQGVELLTLDRWDGPDTYRQLYELDMAATADVPSTETFVPHELDSWRLWFIKPGLYRDRFWLARRDGRLLGFSLLTFPKRAPVMTDFTAVARDARGRGIARALKCETLVQAIDLGVASVRTENDFENAPILHLNEDFGYRSRPGWIFFLKDVA